MTADYQEYAPGAALEPFVECFWSVTALYVEPAHLVLPDGCVDIVFSTHGGLRVVGTMTTRQAVTLLAGERFAGIRFHPGGAGAFLRLPLCELTDQSAPLEDIWGRRGRQLDQRLGETKRIQESVSVLAGSLRPPEHGENPLRRALGAVVAARGQVDLDAVASQAGLSPRQFRRRCLEETGLAPKRLCRVLRFRRTLRLARPGMRDGWAYLAAECGYYDQAHLIHEFRQLSGYTPAQYAAQRCR